MSPVAELASPRTRKPARRPRRQARRRTSLFAHGEPMVWLTGGSLVIALMMIAGLLALVVYQGARTFWPRPLPLFVLADGSRHMGEVTGVEGFTPSQEVLDELAPDVRERALAALAEDVEDGEATRRLVRTGNFELTGEHFRWIEDYAIVATSEPEWALVVERLAWGRFYGTPAAFRVDGEVVATDPAEVWALYQRHHEPSRERFAERRELERDDVGEINRRLTRARRRVEEAELSAGAGSPAWQAAVDELERIDELSTRAFAEVRAQIDALEDENERYQLVLATADGTEQPLVVAEIVRAYTANQLSLADQLGIYLSRWGEFLWDEPREANNEGGVYPAIFGTVVMTLIMSVLVVPFGVLAALYLREYAKQGTIISIVRIAVNNLAGVPSIVFGVFGLGFFCYIIGAGIDELWLPFRAKLPTPTFGTGGLLWASATLALLTLPVVIVATEEALAAVPNSMREGSYACGATKWQTIRRIVLPRAAPGIMTGMILAIARGAGEVAPLMLVGAVKLVRDLPVDAVPPFIHPERSFMHLGFHIFDLGFQSQNSEAAKPMVYTTTLLLIAIIVALNLTAISIRARLRRRFHGVHV